jgi:hypothetical protein
MEQRITEASIYLDTIELISVKLWQKIVLWEPRWLFVVLVFYWNILFLQPSMLYFFPLLLISLLYYSYRNAPNLLIKSSLIEAKLFSDKFFGDKTRFYGEVLRIFREKVSTEANSSSLLQMSMGVLSLFSAPPTSIYNDQESLEFRAILESRFQRIHQFLVSVDVFLSEMITKLVYVEQVARNPQEYPDVLHKVSLLTILSLLAFYHIPVWLPIWLLGNVGIGWEAPCRQQAVDWLDAKRAFMASLWHDYQFRSTRLINYRQQGPSLYVYYPKMAECVERQYLYIDIYEGGRLSNFPFSPPSVLTHLRALFQIFVPGRHIRVIYVYENEKKVAGVAEDGDGERDAPSRPMTERTFTDEDERIQISLERIETELVQGLQWQSIDTEWLIVPATATTTSDRPLAIDKIDPTLFFRLQVPREELYWQHGSRDKVKRRIRARRYLMPF